MPDKVKNLAVVALTAVFLLGFFLWGLIQPDAGESESERRPLAALPEATGESVLSGEFTADFEQYTQDQFPLREYFRTVKALTVLKVLGQKDNNGVFIERGYVSKLDYPLDVSSVEYALSRFQYVYDRYLAGKEMKVYLSVVPDKNYFLAAQNGYPSMDYEELFRSAREGMSYAEYIDIVPFLEVSDYYATDIHWRQEKIMDAAFHIGKEMGVSLENDYTLKKLDQPFYGVYYGQSALPLSPDALYYLDSPQLRRCRVYDYETDSYLPVYDMQKAGGRDPYEVFLSGAKALLTIENPEANTDKELILFRDSFGSSLAPILAQGYSKITLVDIRYLSPGLLDRFLAFDDQEVLFLYSAPVWNHSAAIK